MGFIDKTRDSDSNNIAEMEEEGLSLNELIESLEKRKKEQSEVLENKI